MLYFNVNMWVLDNFLRFGVLICKMMMFLEYFLNRIFLNIKNVGIWLVEY